MRHVSAHQRFFLSDIAFGYQSAAASNGMFMKPTQLWLDRNKRSPPPTLACSPLLLLLLRGHPTELAIRTTARTSDFTSYMQGTFEAKDGCITDVEP